MVPAERRRTLRVIAARSWARRLRLAVPILAVLLASGFDAAGRTAIWIDTDPSIGPVWREVDDAFALVMAFHSPEVRIAGISTSYGNVGVRRTTSVARDMARRFGVAAGVTANDVHMGARSPRERGKATTATGALAATLRKEKVTYLALGPLTNLASFLSLHPELAPRIDRVIFVGGLSPGYSPRFGPTGALRIHDANVFKDPAAVRAVLLSDVPIVLAPVETSSQLWLDHEDVRTLGASGRAGEFLQRRTRGWIWFWTKLVKEKGGVLFDPLAVIAVTRPQLIEFDRRYAVVDRRGNLIASHRRSAGSREVRFCARLKPAARKFLMERLQGPPGRRE
jgi:pyrimidine-specific ribonucleoside hydrolase